MSSEFYARVSDVVRDIGYDFSKIPKELWGQVEFSGLERRQRSYFVIGTRFAGSISGLHKRRFSWHTAGEDFWGALSRDIRVHILGGSENDIDTLGDLMDAMYGVEACMEDAGTGDGFYRANPIEYIPKRWPNLAKTLGDDWKDVIKKQMASIEIPDKQGKVETRLKDHPITHLNGEHYSVVLNLSLDRVELIRLLGLYNFELSQESSSIKAVEKPYLKEDRRCYEFHIDVGQKKTTIAGCVLPTKGPGDEILEEEDLHFWNRGLKDFVWNVIENDVLDNHYKVGHDNKTSDSKIPFCSKCNEIFNKLRQELDDALPT